MSRHDHKSLRNYHITSIEQSDWIMFKAATLIGRFVALMAVSLVGAV